MGATVAESLEPVSGRLVGRTPRLSVFQGQEGLALPQEHLDEPITPAYLAHPHPLWLPEQSSFRLGRIRLRQPMPTMTRF